MGSENDGRDAYARSVGTLKVAFLIAVILLGLLGMPVILAAIIEGK